ncbi:hypothetical protein IG922_004718 [Salmonella enterica]|nr:hypothetical protein [Salmonella enterica]
MIKRLKEMESHFRQLEGDRKPLVLEAIDHLDRFIEDLLLEQEYEGKSSYIREYRKHFSLHDLKKHTRLNRIVSINSLDDGHIREFHPNDSADYKKEKALEFAKRQKQEKTKWTLRTKGIK